MAIVKLGPIVSGISGKVGTVVFANAKQGLIIRPTPIRRAASSPFLSEARVRLQNIRITWSTLTAAQQASWNTLAKTTYTPNRIGQSSPMSAFHLFVRTNMQLRRNHDAIFADAPNLAVGPTPRTVAAAFSASGDFTINAQPPPGFGSAIFYAYGWPFWVNHDTRSSPRLVFLRRQAAPSIGLDVRAEWEQHFGTMVEGQRFVIAVATEVGNAPRSTQVIVRSAVTA